MDRVIYNNGNQSMAYEWGLAGPDGAWFTLYPDKNQGRDEIEAAKTQLYRDRDVVSIRVDRGGERHLDEAASVQEFEKAVDNGEAVSLFGLSKAIRRVK